MEVLKTNPNSVGGKIQQKADEKGSFGNRLEYSIKQAWNFGKTQYKDGFYSTLGTAASIGAAAGVAKSKVAQNVLKKSFNSFKDSGFGKACKKVAAEFAPFAKKVFTRAKALPTPAKAVLGAGLLATALVSRVIRNKGLYKAGKLDQEYTDKAKLQKTLYQKILFSM